MRSDGGVLYTQIESQLPQFVQQQHPKFTQFIEKYYEFMELNLLTITDVNLNEDKPIQESDVVTHTVTVATGNNDYSNSTNKLFVGGAVSPTVNVVTGTTYVFDQSDSTNDTHILRISTTPDGRHSPGGEEYSNGVNVVAFGTPGTAGAQTSVYIEPDLANTYLYYYCNNHSGMGGSIRIADSTPYIALESSNTTSSDYLDLENPNRQGVQFLSGEIIYGLTSGAEGIVRGKYSNTRTFVEESNEGQFVSGETVKGKTSRVTAVVNTYTRQPLNAARNLKSFQDVDKAPAGFVELFRKEFLDGMPKDILADKNKVLKNIKDYYRAKGNEASFKYIFRLLYGKEDVSFYYPSTDMLRLSDGRWTLDKTLKIDNNLANNFSAFEGRIIRGQSSNVTAIVERTQTYQIGATTISELYLSEIDANNAADGYTTFGSNEKLTTTTADSDGNYASANTTGILQSITVTAGGSNYKVGEDILVSGGGGDEAAVKVASVSDATISDFNIIDGGDGYAVGDSVSFVNEGTGGTGASARVATIVPTANIITTGTVINTVKDDTLSASAFSSPFDTKNANDHMLSNSTTTFSASFSGTAPKKGDLLFLAERGGFLTEDGLTLKTEHGDNEFDREADATINNYDGDTAKVGTVVHVAGSAVTYAIGSIFTDPVTGTKTIKNFADDDVISVYDTQKDKTGSAKAANGYNAVMYDTGVDITLSNTPAVVTSNTYHGTFTEKVTSVGSIRSIQVLSSGQGYASIPVVTIANTISISYGNDPAKFGANSIFLKLNTSIANDFSGNTIIKNEGNTAVGTVLDPIDSNTGLVDTGNTYLRVKMTSANTFSGTDTITSYSNEDSPTATLIGDFVSANLVTTGSPATTVTITQASHGLTAGQKISITGSAKASSDANKYNNVHTVATVTNTSVFTITLPSAPTNTAAENLLLTRRVVTSNLSSSNTTWANTGINGNNAVISIASIAIGAIETLSIYNFGAGYTSAPSLDASQAGDGNATLSANLGALAEYDGYFTGTQGLLSAQGKLQDNFYYQNFSYVIKTDVDIATYRNKITDLCHPAGLSMFGEVAMYLAGVASFMGSGTRDINFVQANTAQVANTLGVPSYRTHVVQHANQNTASQNTQVSFSSTPNIILTPPVAIDNRMEFPGIDYDLLLEQEGGGIGTEGSGCTIGLETQETLLYGKQLMTEHGTNTLIQDNGPGEQTIRQFQTDESAGGEYESLLQEDDVSKFLFEDYFDSIIQEDGYNLELEDQQVGDNYLLFEPLEADAWILSEDDTDSFHIIQEDNVPIFNIIMEEASGEGRILYEATTPYLDPTQTANTFMLGVEPPVIDATNYLLLEAVQAIYDSKITVTDRDEERGFLLPKIEFPEEEVGSVHIDMGFGSQLRLETDLYDSIQLEYTLQMDLLTEDGQPLQTESLDNKFIATDLFHGSAGETGDILLETGGLVLNETQSVDIETEGFDYELLMLEDTNGMFPVYLAMEDTMTDEVISDHVITIVPGSREEHADEFQLLTEHSTGESSGGYTITHSELVTEGGDKLVGESAQDALGISAQTRMGGEKFASGKGEAVAGFIHKLEGTITFKSGDDFELLAEDGKRFVSESDFTFDNVLSEAGDTFVDERDANRQFVREAGDPADGESFVFLRASYDRKAEAVGTGTFFETDFNAPIVLEDRTGVIELEHGTSQEELIVLENSTDRIFEYLLAEADQAFDRIAHENYDVNETKSRLVHQEYLDVIIDESGVALEEDFKVQLEDYCSTPSMQTLVAENGDNLELEHIETTFFGDERLIAIENLANERELTISDFTPSLALETDLYVAPESIILESHTTWTDGAEFGLILHEDDSLIATERTDDQGRQCYILHEEHYAHEFNEGTVTVLNDYDPDDSHSANQSTIEIQLDGDTKFPHGVRSSNAKIIFHAINDSADVVSVGNPITDSGNTLREHIIQADFGSFLLESGDGVILDDADGDKVKRDLGFATSQNYVLRYGIAERNESDVNFLKVEENTSVTSSDTPDYWQYTINGWKSTVTADTTVTPAELKERVGNDIVLEDGERLLTEDGEVTQDNLTLLLEDDNYLNMEENDSLLFEEVDYYHPSKMLYYEEQLYRIDYIANNTFFKVSTGEELYPILDATIKTQTTELVSS